MSQGRVDVFIVSEMKINLGIYMAICRSFLFILAFSPNYCVLCFIKKYGLCYDVLLCTTRVKSHGCMLYQNL